MGARSKKKTAAEPVSVEGAGTEKRELSQKKSRELVVIPSGRNEDIAIVKGHSRNRLKEEAGPEKTSFQAEISKGTIPGFETGRLARDRLKSLLICDRIDSACRIMEMLKFDIARVVSNYMEIEDGEVEIRINQDVYGDSVLPVLRADIPIRRVKKMA